MFLFLVYSFGMTTKRSETSPGEERVRGYMRMLVLTFEIIGLALAVSVFQSCSSDAPGVGRAQHADPISPDSTAIAHVPGSASSLKRIILHATVPPRTPAIPGHSRLPAEA